MRIFITVLIFNLLLGHVFADTNGSATESAPAPETAVTKPETAIISGGKVFVLPITGPIDKGMLFVFRRAFREMKRLKPDFIIAEINTPGGALKETREIVAWLSSTKLPVYAFVNTEAISAGAIISLGCQKIFMTPAAQIGSALPIAGSPMGGGQEITGDYKEKVLSYVRSMVRSLAQENGHAEDVAMAMVDPAIEVKRGDHVVCRSGELLNLTAREAIDIFPPDSKPLLAEAIVDDLPALLEHLGYVDVDVQRFEMESSEQLARYITMIAPLLLLIGLGGVWLEMRTPGFGLPGITGACCLLIFFFGHYVAGLAGLEDILLVAIGLALIAVEVFVLPGFGFVGVFGLLFLIAGLVMSGIPALPDFFPVPDAADPFPYAYLNESLQKLFITLLLAVPSAWLLSKILPRTSAYRNLVLSTELSNANGYVASDVTHNRGFLGVTGVAMTMLRPAGTAIINDERVDVVSSGDMIERGAPIKVIQVEGSRIVVQKNTEVS